MNIRMCNRCIMNDSSDETIVFDEYGICNYCKSAIERRDKIYLPNEKGQQKLNELLLKIKEDGKGKQYDCVMGISGGLDSSYLAYLGYRWGLRVLAIHINDGFDTEISKQNIKKLMEKTQFDYQEVIPDTTQFNALTLSYMKAGVPNIAVPQDNVLFAFLYKQMKKYKIKYFLCGTNFALESILQRGNSYKNSDVVNIKDIHKHFFVQPINKLEFISSTQILINKFLYGIKTESPLNYVDYNRDRAFKELYEFCGFEYYGGKHLENSLTAFIQLYWLPKKFNFDKRSSHLSSMIVSGQMTREEALKEFSLPPYDNALMDKYIEKIKDSLGISDDELQNMICGPNRAHTDFKVENDKFYYRLIEFLHKFK